jgi:hypothetical protein
MEVSESAHRSRRWQGTRQLSGVRFGVRRSCAALEGSEDGGNHDINEKPVITSLRQRETG